MLKIRLRRMGSRHRPFYRVVVSDSRRTPTAAALEELGYYDPRRSPSVFKVDLEKLDAWVAKGAQPSATISKLVKKARKGGMVDLDAASDKEAQSSAAAETKADEAEKKAEKKADEPKAEKKADEPKAEKKAEEKAEAAAEEAPAAEKADEEKKED